MESYSTQLESIDEQSEGGQHADSGIAMEGSFRNAINGKTSLISRSHSDNFQPRPSHIAPRTPSNESLLSQIKLLKHTLETQKREFEAERLKYKEEKVVSDKKINDLEVEKKLLMTLLSER